MKKLIHIFPVLLLAGILSGTLQTASGVEDPFAPVPEGKMPKKNNGPANVSICVETFSIEMADAPSLYQGQSGDPALYKEITNRVTKGKARQEGFSVLRARSGNKAVLKAVSEFIYPVSYLSVTKPGEKQSPTDQAIGTSPFPSDFKTQDVGFTLEIDPTTGMDDTIIDLRIAPSFVSLTDRAKWGSTQSATETPVFDFQEIFSAYTLRSGEPQLLSTLSRPPVSKLDADSAKRVWFAFVTAKIVPVTPEK